MSDKERQVSSANGTLFRLLEILGRYTTKSRPRKTLAFEKPSSMVLSSENSDPIFTHCFRFYGWLQNQCREFPFTPLECILLSRV